MVIKKAILIIVLCLVSVNAWGCRGCRGWDDIDKVEITGIAPLGDTGIVDIYWHYKNPADKLENPYLKNNPYNDWRYRIMKPVPPEIMEKYKEVQND